MSWSAESDGPVRKDGPLAVPSPANIGRESNEQFELAVQAANLLATLVGGDHGMVTVQMTGHANARHADPDGEGDGPNSPEFITVQVAALPREKAKASSKRS